MFTYFCNIEITKLKTVNSVNKKEKEQRMREEGKRKGKQIYKSLRQPGWVVAFGQFCQDVDGVMSTQDNVPGGDRKWVRSSEPTGFTRLCLAHVILFPRLLSRAKENQRKCAHDSHKELRAVFLGESLHKKSWDFLLSRWLKNTPFLRNGAFS